MRKLRRMTGRPYGCWRLWPVLTSPLCLRMTHHQTSIGSASKQNIQSERIFCKALRWRILVCTRVLCLSSQRINVYKVSLIAMMTGSDFIKTSAGKESVNATYPVTLVMAWAIWDYYWKTGIKVGFKFAWVICSAKTSLIWLSLVKEELDDEWLIPEFFCIGASTLLAHLERQIYQHVTCRYAVHHNLPKAWVAKIWVGRRSWRKKLVA